MKSFATLIAFPTVVVFAQPTLAQPEDVNPASRHLEQFEPLVGEWYTRDGRFRYTYKWVLKNRFLYCARESQHPIKNEINPFEISIIGWDSEKKSLTASEFSGGWRGSTGSHLLRRVERKGDDTWFFGRPFASVLTPDSAEYNEITLRLENKDQLTFSSTAYDREGKERNKFSVELQRTK